MEDTKVNIFDGVQEDCETILIRFEKLKSARFTDFAKIWKEMEFVGIYGNKQLPDIDLFVTELLYMVKQYFIKAATFNLKVGVLYLLYGLYYKQPLKSYKKILVTYTDWLVIKEFIKESKLHNHYDTLLILYKLISDNAFHWSATNYTKTDITSQPNFRYGLFYTNSLIDDTVLDNELYSLKEIEEQYLEARNAACENASSSVYKEKINYSSNIAQELSNILNDTNDYASVTQANKTTATADKSVVEDDIGQRRKILKSKIFQEKVSPTKKSS